MAICFLSAGFHMLMSYSCDPYASTEMILAFAGEKFS
jgi:hypothetical protein